MHHFSSPKTQGKSYTTLKLLSQVAKEQKNTSLYLKADIDTYRQKNHCIWERRRCNNLIKHAIFHIFQFWNTTVFSGPTAYVILHFTGTVKNAYTDYCKNPACDSEKAEILKVCSDLSNNWSLKLLSNLSILILQWRNISHSIKELICLTHVPKFEDLKGRIAEIMLSKSILYLFRCKRQDPHLYEEKYL